MTTDPTKLRVAIGEKPLSARRQVRLFIAQTLFHELMDGYAHNDPKRKELMWRHIDRELNAAKLTRDDL